MLPPVVLQLCPAGTDPSRYGEAFANGEFFDTLVCVFADKLPLPVLALLVFGSIGMSYYQVQRSPIVPMIMLILIGGTTIALAPASVGTAVVVLFVLGLTGVGWLFYQRAAGGGGR